MFTRAWAWGLTLSPAGSTLSSAASHRLYSGSSDCTINVWNISDEFELLMTLEGHANPVCTLAVANGMLFSGSLKLINVGEVDSGFL